MELCGVQTYDLVDKHISMETCDALAILDATKQEGDSPRGCISASSSEKDNSSKRSDSPDEANAAQDLSLKNAETSDAPSGAKRVEALAEENRRLQAAIEQYEIDLSQSRNDTHSANQRVSTLVNELVSMKKKLEDTSKRDKKESIPRMTSWNEGSLVRQMSSTSETMESASKRSLVSRKSSAKSVIGRSGSLPVKPEPLSTQTQRSLNLPANAEIEAHKLAFAEQLVEKEEAIMELEHQVDFTLGHLRQIEAGIDGVETRFARELDTYKMEMSRKFQSLFQQAQELFVKTTKSGQRMTELQKEMHKLGVMISQDVRSLEQSVRKKDQQKLRVTEEKRILRRKFDAKLQECDKSEQLLRELREEGERQKSQNATLRGEIRQLEDKIAFLNSRLADLTIEGQEGDRGAAQAEIDTLNDRISSLEAGLSEYESKNRSLVQELDEAHAKLDEIQAPEDMDIISKENRELRQEISDVSEKLVDLEQENNALREETDQLNEMLNQFTALEERVQGLQKTNQELESHLTRKKKHFDELQGELKELRLKIQNHETDIGFDTCSSQDTISTQLDAVIHAEKRYCDLEKALSDIQAERSQLIEEKASKNKMVHTLIKENKGLSSSLKKLQKQSSKLTSKLEEAKAENAALQGSMHSSSSSRHSSRGRYNDDADLDLTQELVNAKVTLAENDERQIKLRRDLHKSMARNMVLAAKATRLETLLREMKQERGGFIRRKTTKTFHLP